MNKQILLRKLLSCLKEYFEFIVNTNHLQDYVFMLAMLLSPGEVLVIVIGVAILVFILARRKK